MLHHVKVVVSLCKVVVCNTLNVSMESLLNNVHHSKFQFFFINDLAIYTLKYPSHPLCKGM